MKDSGEDLLAFNSVKAQLYIIQAYCSNGIAVLLSVPKVKQGTVKSGPFNTISCTFFCECFTIWTFQLPPDCWFNSSKTRNIVDSKVLSSHLKLTWTAPLPACSIAQLCWLYSCIHKLFSSYSLVASWHNRAGLCDRKRRNQPLAAEWLTLKSSCWDVCPQSAQIAYAHTGRACELLLSKWPWAHHLCRRGSENCFSRFKSW